MTSDRRKKAMPIRWRNFTALGWLLALPAAAQAQSFSPGDLVVAQPPSLSSGPTLNSILGTPPVTTPPGVSPPEFQYAAYGDLSERYATNAQGGSGGSSDFDSRAEVGVNATETTARLNASLAYNGALDYFAQAAGNVIFTNNLAGHALVDVLPDHFNLSADAAIAPTYSTQLGAVAPAGEVPPPGANSDFRTTYSFDVNPDFYFRLGDFLRSDTLPSYSATFFGQPSGANLLPNVGNDIYTDALTQRVTTGDYFSQLELSIIANYAETSRSNFTFIQRSATGEAAYAFMHDLSIVFDGGYQTVKANIPLAGNLNGPVFLGGFRLDGPYLTGQILAGEQYRSFSVVGNLTYQITPLLTLSAAATDNVGTPGAIGTTNVTGLSSNPLLSSILAGIASGQIQTPASGILALNQGNLAGVGLESTISRIKSQSVAVSYGLDRLTAVVTGFATEQTNIAGTLAGQNSNLQSIGVTTSLNYALSDDLSAGADIAYTTQGLAVGRDDTEQFDLHADYNLGQLTRLYGEFTFFNRDSNAKLAAFSAASGSYSGESVRIGIHRQF